MAWTASGDSSFLVSQLMRRRHHHEPVVVDDVDAAAAAVASNCLIYPLMTPLSSSRA